MTLYYNPMEIASCSKEQMTNNCMVMRTELNTVSKSGVKFKWWGNVVIRLTWPISYCVLHATGCAHWKDL